MKRCDCREDGVQARVLYWMLLGAIPLALSLAYLFASGGVNPRWLVLVPLSWFGLGLLIGLAENIADRAPAEIDERVNAVLEALFFAPLLAALYYRHFAERHSLGSTAKAKAPVAKAPKRERRRIDWR